MRNCIIILLISVLSLSAGAQTPFNKGVNLTGWFQAANARQIQFTKYTKHDFINIKSLGCDVIRLPINLNHMTGGSPNYTLDPLFFYFLDSAVTWAEQLNIYLILDNHTFDPNVNTDPNIGTVLNKVWLQMAQRYASRSNYILYEVLNEPHGISAQSWGQIQQTVINTIRTVDTKHTIVVGGVGYNSYNDLATLPVYTDKNLLYTFHFYDPFMFTHQGASWVAPSMEPLSGVPFPYNAAKMPACPASLKGSWIEGSLNYYANDGTVAKVKAMIDIAVNFKNTRNVPVFCGEFGVYIPNSNNTDRVFWYEIVRKYLEEKAIPWTIWDYQGGFGIFNKNSNELFEYDVNTELVQKLGLTVPQQSSFIPKPETSGFALYSDFMGASITDVSSNSGALDFYNNSLPNNGKFCIYWAGAAQYNSVGFGFKPQKDFSTLVAENYALDFIVRGDAANTAFVLRFTDTKTDAADHPWRMDFTIDDKIVPWDKKWHHVRIPLKNFSDAGSYDNNQWYNAVGKFDWKTVARFDIVAEKGALTGKGLWFDNLYLSNQDTAKIYTNIALSLTPELPTYWFNLQVFPNPTNDNLSISYFLPESAVTNVVLYSSTGRVVKVLQSQFQTSGNYNIDLNLKSHAGTALPAGFYICRISTGKFSEMAKIVLL